MPPKSGQQQRVFYTLKATRELFDITFFATVNKENLRETQKELLAISDDVILLPSRYSHNIMSKAWNKLIGGFYTLLTGLKFSNYLVGQIEFSPGRLRDALDGQEFDCALFEYWHAVESVPYFRNKGIPCVLDMHNILWQSYIKQLNARRFLPKWWKDWAILQYQQQEERAWRQFDGVISINASEYEYTRSKVPNSVTVFYTPMGTDLSLWPYSWQPLEPPIVAYYGGLGSEHNQQDALLCYELIMPIIWREYPNIQLWLIGSNPPEFLLELAKNDHRVKVTGFVERIQDVLSKVSIVLCPWSGTYGFRSRLVEVMALGVPVVASSEAVHGMQLEAGRGIFLEETPEHMARACVNLLRQPDFAKHQSRLARQLVEEKFSYEITYGKLANYLFEFLKQKKSRESISRNVYH